MQKITKKSSIMEILNKYPETMPVFMKYNIHCIGCIASQFENIEQGAIAHGIDPDKIVSDLNKEIEKNKKKVKTSKKLK